MIPYTHGAIPSARHLTYHADIEKHRVANDSRLTRAQDEQPAAPAVTNHAVTVLGGVTLDMNSAGAEEAADRALSAVARKLDAALSVEHTVNELIHEASDPANLCMMYHGQCAVSLDAC